MKLAGPAVCRCAPWRDRVGERRCHQPAVRRQAACVAARYGTRVADAHAAGRFGDDATAAEVVAVAAALVVVGSVMARFVPVNTFSLHGMYRERLIRAFLGASRASGMRRPNPFTGFDVSDNLPMHALRQSGRPLHVVNTTLNRVAEKGLGMQFRKSESFTITPLHAGSAAIDSYRPSDRYADDWLGGAPAAFLSARRSQSRGRQRAPTWARDRRRVLPFS